MHNIEKWIAALASGDAVTCVVPGQHGRPDWVRPAHVVEILAFGALLRVALDAPSNQRLLFSAAGLQQNAGAGWHHVLRAVATAPQPQRCLISGRPLAPAAEKIAA